MYSTSARYHPPPLRNRWTVGMDLDKKEEVPLLLLKPAALAWSVSSDRTDDPEGQIRVLTRQAGCDARSAPKLGSGNTAPRETPNG